MAPKNPDETRKTPRESLPLYKPPSQRPSGVKTDDLTQKDLTQKDSDLVGKMRLINKRYDEIEPGVVVMDRCLGLTVFSGRTGTGEVTREFNNAIDLGYKYNGKLNNVDRQSHPQIVIGKNTDGSLQTVMCTSFGMGEGLRLGDKKSPSLDAKACKYYVPTEGRPHERNYEDKGQPGFTINFTNDRFISLRGEKSAGWACSFMYFTLLPTGENKTFRVAEEVSITPQSLERLIEEIDKNEQERIEFIDANRGLFDDRRVGNFNDRRINMLKSRGAFIGASKATPPGGPQEKAGPTANARLGRNAGSPSGSAPSQTSDNSDQTRGTDGTGGRGGGGSHDRGTGGTSTGSLGKRGLAGSRWAQ